MSVGKISYRDVFHVNPWRLSTREARICTLLVTKTIEEAAQELGLSRATVSDEVKTIHAKMGVRRTTEAVVLFDRWWQTVRREEHPDFVRQLNDRMLATGKGQYDRRLM